MKIRNYVPADLPAVMRLFYETVHNVNATDYSVAQLDAWAPKEADAAAWATALEGSTTFVAVFDGHLAGFGNILPDGYLDRLYVHPDCLGRGIASKLLCSLEDCAAGHGCTKIVTHASITARPFFTARGYGKARRNVVRRKGVELVNYRMEKQL